MSENLQLRIYGDPALPTLIYLPGLHGDWTLVASFREAMRGCVRFVEMNYPRTLTWSIADYADAIREALLGQGIDHGWLLGESFGSQVAWALIERGFQADGVILAGGFVKHPFKWGPGALSLIGRMMPMSVYQIALRIYAAYARFRHRRAPEVLEGMKEFVSRRTGLDREAMRHRLALIEQYDARPVARQTRLPVYYAAGLVDPLVPFVLVRLWLRKHCPGYRGGRTFWRADHNVLATAPAQVANTAKIWMQRHANPCCHLDRAAV